MMMRSSLMTSAAALLVVTAAAALSAACSTDDPAHANADCGPNGRCLPDASGPPHDQDAATTPTPDTGDPSTEDAGPTTEDMAPGGGDMSTGDMGSGTRDMGAGGDDMGMGGGDMGAGVGDMGGDMAPPRCTDPREPNDTKAGATIVTHGDRFDEVVICAQTSIQDDLDLYRVTLAGGQTLSVTTTFSNDPANLDMTLFAANDTISTTSTGVAYTATFDDTETLTYTSTAPETYYLLVFANVPADAPYTIEFSVR